MKFQTLFLLILGSLLVDANKPFIFDGGFIEEIVKNITLLGTVSSRSPFQENSVYYEVDSSVPWEVAGKVCLDAFHEDATLVNIETPEELEAIQKLLENAGLTATSFWTEGGYVSRRAQFSWAGGEIIATGPGSGWEPDHPNERTSATKVTIGKSVIPGSWTYRSENENTLHGFICEEIPGSGEIPVPCQAQNDLIIIMDSSSGISQPDFQLLNREFNAVIAEDTLAPSRVSFMTFADYVVTRFHLTDNVEPSVLRNVISNSAYHGGRSNAHTALYIAQLEFSRNGLAGVPQNVVLVTGSRPANMTETKSRAEELREAEVVTFVVGFGGGVDSKELEEIAGDSRRVFEGKDWDELKVKMKALTKSLCSGY